MMLMFDFPELYCKLMQPAVGFPMSCLKGAFPTPRSEAMECLATLGKPSELKVLIGLALFRVPSPPDSNLGLEAVNAGCLLHMH